MYPYNFPGNNPQNASQFNPVNYPQTIYYAQQQSQPGFVYQQPLFVNCPANVPVQVSTPQSFQAVPNPRPISSVVPVVKNEAEEKQKRYKLEQQRKFKNFRNISKTTDIDSMLSNIVPPSQKPTPQKSKPVKEPDDFGEFLQAPSQPGQTAGSEKSKDVEPITKSNGQAIGAIADLQALQQLNASMVIPNQPSSKKSGVDLQSKMMASLDLNQSHHAYLKFKPIAKQAPKRPEKKTFVPSNKAANWSALAAVEGEFQDEAITPPPLMTSLTPPPSPSSNRWLTDIATAPMVYQHVYEACLSQGGLMDTSRLYPILLQCNLSNDILGELWTLANQKVPGRLDQEELFVLLALIALTQGGKRNLTVDYVRGLTAPPVPYLTAYVTSPTPPVPPLQSPAKISIVPMDQPSLLNVANDDIDDFQDFQSNDNIVPELGHPNSAFHPIKAHPPSLKAKNTSPTPKSLSPLAAQARPIFPDVTIPNEIDSSTLQHKDAMVNSALAATSEIIGKDSNLIPASVPVKENLRMPFTADIVKSPQLFKKNVFTPVSETAPVSVGSAQMKSIVSQLSATDETTKPQKPGFSSPLELQKPFATSGVSPNVDKTVSFNHGIQPKVDKSAKSDLIAELKEDKYAAFSSINDDNMDNFNLFRETAAVDDLPTIPSILDYPNQTPPSYKSVRSSEQFANPTEKPPLFRSDGQLVKPMTSSAGIMSESSVSVMGIAAKSNSTKFDLFKTAISRIPTKNSSPIQPDTASVQSLELSLSRAISQQSLGTVDQPTVDSRTSPKPRSPSQKYGPSFCDDDYDTLGIDVPPDMPPPDTFDDFDDFQEGNSSLANFDAFSAFEPPPKKQPIQSLRKSPVEQKRIQSKSPQTVGLSPDLFTAKRHSFDNMQRAEVPIPLKPPSPDKRRASSLDAEPVRSRHSSGVESIEFSLNDWNINSTAVSDVDNYVMNWEKCLTACCEVIVNTNQILSSIDSPTVCNEVVYSLKGQRFISDLSEVYGVAKRVCASSIKMKIEKETLQNLHKQIELSWHNLLAFCSNVPVIDHSVVASDAEGACGVCLLALNSDTITYAGKEYHATCANFWINRVDHVLPALQVVS